MLGGGLHPRGSHLEMSEHHARVEIEDLANALKGVGPFRFVSEQPALRFAEELVTLRVRRQAIALYAIDHVIKNGNHEPFLGTLRAPVEVLRRQNDVELGSSFRNSGRGQVAFASDGSSGGRSTSPPRPRSFARGYR